MLGTGDIGNAQSLDNTFITSDAIFAHFIFEEKRKI